MLVLPDGARSRSLLKKPSEELCLLRLTPGRLSPRAQCSPCFSRGAAGDCDKQQKTRRHVMPRHVQPRLAHLTLIRILIRGFKQFCPKHFTQRCRLVQDDVFYKLRHKTNIILLMLSMNKMVCIIMV